MMTAVSLFEAGSCLSADAQKYLMMNEDGQMDPNMTPGTEEETTAAPAGDEETQEGGEETTPAAE